MPTPSLYVREKNPAGNWRYRRIKEGRGVRTGDLAPPFYVLPFLDGKQVWKTLSFATFTEAKEEADRLALAFDAQARGLTVAQAESLTNANRIPIKTAIETYLEQQSGKAIRTVAQYRLTLNEFIEALGGRVRFLDEITEDVLRKYKKYLVAKGHAGKTIDTRLNVVFFVLKKNGIKARIPRDEMPVVEDEIAVPYTDDELKRLFAKMNEGGNGAVQVFPWDPAAVNGRLRSPRGRTSTLIRRPIMFAGRKTFISRPSPTNLAPFRFPIRWPPS